MTGKKNRKMNIPPKKKKKMSILIAFAVKNTQVTTISLQKVKLLNTKCLKCKHHKSMLLKQTK